MKTPKRPKDILERLIPVAAFEGIMYGERERQERQKRRPVGSMITSLSDEDRSLLKELKSNDIKDVRYGK